jgi:pyridoxal phosphate enzyme (YggS family)
MESSQRSIIAGNIASIREKIEQAAQRSGRTSDDVCLIAVTKYVGAELTRLVVETGCHHLGESRPQLLWEKAETLSDLKPNWHMIGHLQRNKVRRTLPWLSCLHSIDSPRLLTALHDECVRDNCEVRGLLEINVSGDASKTGMTEDDAKQLVGQLSAVPRVKVVGLMGMASRDGDLQSAQHEFAKLREIRDRLQTCTGSEIELRELSMGMSHDFAEAIAEGSTMVRIGSSLFEGIL